MLQSTNVLEKKHKQEGKKQVSSENDIMSQHYNSQKCSEINSTRMSFNIFNQKTLNIKMNITKKSRY